MGSGERAEEVLRTESFDAAIIDIGLPAMDGLELTRRLRRTGMASPAMPVLILTARDALHDRVQGLDLGADDYMVKPFDCPSCWRGCARCCGVAGGHHGGAEFCLPSSMTAGAARASGRTTPSR